MVPGGYPIAEEQFAILTRDLSDNSEPLKLKGKNNVYSTEGVSFAVDPSTGAIVSLLSGGTELLSTPITLSLFRPFTENDAHPDGTGKVWNMEGLDKVSQKLVSSKLKNNVLTVDTRIFNRDDRQIGTATFRYSVRPDNRLAVECMFNPDTAVIRTIPRLGLTYRTPETLACNVSYVGRGGETYVDRNTAGRVGRHNTSPEADFHNYIVPQSTGNHTDVRSVEFNGDLLTVTSDRLFQFSAVPYSDENIQAAKHIKDLAGDGMVTVHLDAEQTGVGTATCGPDILPKYRLPIEPTEFIFFFKVK